MTYGFGSRGFALALFASLGAAVWAAQPAAARVGVGIGIGVPLYPPPVVYPPYYYAPPPPVVYAPPPPIYVPPPAQTAMPAPPPQTQSQTCREYQSTAIIDGRPQQTYGTACLQPDGTWRIIR